MNKQQYHPFPYYDLIKEGSRIVSFPLDFEDYCFFIYPGRLFGDRYIYDKARHLRVKDIVFERFGPVSGDIIHKAGMAFALRKAKKRDLFLHPELHLDAMALSYEMIQSISVPLLEKTIGHGFTSVVFGHGDDLVIKEPYNGFSLCEMTFYQHQMSNPLSVFPKVIYVSEKEVVMERLLVDTPQLDEYRKCIRKYIDHRFSEEVGYRTLKMEIDVSDSNFRSFVQRVMEGFRAIFNVSAIGDLTAENLGERRDTGEVVLIDPLDGRMIKEWG